MEDSDFCKYQDTLGVLKESALELVHKQIMTLNYPPSTFKSPNTMPPLKNPKNTTANR